LEKQRAEILRQYAHTHRDYLETNEAAADLYDRATIDSSKEFAAFLQHEDSQRWYAINSALAKIEAGSYGLCDECGRPIGEERLHAVPTAAYCLECQTSFEQRQMDDGAGAVRISEEKWEEQYWGEYA
jgi:DnaK suppressor protein